jgi:uncharacterized protein YbjT (DUF2867 family)
MSKLLAAEDWLPVVAGMDAVVNAAGALQDGPRDRLDAIHRGSVVALVTACEQAGVHRFAQISAIGADPASSDAFFSTKAEGDKAVASSSLEWTILRPGLVIAPAAYGGTALLRALAAFPVFVPAVMARRPIQTVAVTDVAEAVSRAVAGSLPPRLAMISLKPRPDRSLMFSQTFGHGLACRRPASCRCRPLSAGLPPSLRTALACLVGDRLCAAQPLSRWRVA